MIWFILVPITVLIILAITKLWIGFLIAFIIFFALYLKYAQISGGVTFHMVAKSWKDSGTDTAEAMSKGFTAMRGRAPFNQLTDDDVNFVVSSFADLDNGIGLVTKLMAEADKAKSVSLLKDREQVKSFRKFVASRQSS